MSNTLPNTYLKLTWLGSTGTQYIDTGYKPTGKTEIEMSWYWNTDGTTRSRAMFGVDTDWLVNSYSQYCDRLFVYGNNTYSQSGVAGGSSTYYHYPSGKHYLKFYNQHFELDNVANFNIAEKSFNCAYNLWLFAHNRANKKESTGGMDRIKFYYGKIWERNSSGEHTLVRDFIPCLRLEDNKPGLYDLVNDEFYINKNAGNDFIYEIEVYRNILPYKNYITDTNTNERYEILKSIEATQEKSSDGKGQWLDTELYMEGSERDSINNANDIFEIKGNFTELLVDNNTDFIMGFHNSGRYVRMYISKVNDNICYGGADGYWNDGGTSTGAIADTNTHTWILNHKRNSISIDGVEYALRDGLNSTNRGTATQTWRENTITFLGNKHDSKYDVGWSGCAKFNVEYIKIYRQNGTVRGYFIPARSVTTGRTGMYDTVNNRFITNGNPAEDAVDFVAHELIIEGHADKCYIVNDSNEYYNHVTLINR